MLNYKNYTKMNKLLVKNFNSSMAAAELTCVSFKYTMFVRYTLETYERTFNRELCDNFQVTTFKSQDDAERAFKEFVLKYL